MNFNSEVNNLNLNNCVGYLTFKSLENISIINHAFSTRLGGVSSNEFSTMNLSFNRGDSDNNVIENYHKFCDSAGFDFNTLVASSQQHGDNIRIVDEQDKGVGIWREQDKTNIDALITNKQDITLVTYFADCTPIFFVDPIRKVIALAHSGWRGTILRIGAKVIDKMKRDFNCKIENIVCAIGPCIGKCCYEVDKNLYQHFSKVKDWNVDEIFEPLSNGKYNLDLCEANLQLLLSAGLRRENVSVSDVCTMCNSELLFSHRATAGKRGGMVAMMCLR